MLVVILILSILVLLLSLFLLFFKLFLFVHSFPAMSTFVFVLPPTKRKIVVINPGYPLSKRLHQCKSDDEFVQIITGAAALGIKDSPGYIVEDGSRKRVSILEYYTKNPPPSYLVGVEPNPGPIYNTIPPSPRLVGIELNPGPPKITALVKFAQALGSSKGNMLQKLLPPPSKTSVTKKKNRRSKNRNISNAQALVPFSKSAYVSAPIALATITKQMSGKGYVAQSFRVLSCQIFANMGGIPYFTQNAGFNVYSGLQLSPLYTPSGFASAPFGRSLLLVASGYMRFRISKLKIEYRPAIPTSANGNVVIGFNSDTYSAVVTDPGSAIGTLSNSISSAVWQPFDLSVRNSDLVSQGNDGWCFAYANSSTTAEEREDAAGGFLPPPPTPS
jgi:hypothetical protein